MIRKSPARHQIAVSIRIRREYLMRRSNKSRLQRLLTGAEDCSPAWPVGENSSALASC
jgi:hypothetical protein